VIRVLLVDDDSTCREGLRQLLSLAPDLEVVGEAGDAEAACELGRRLRPDVVVIDAELPRSSCLEAMLRLSGGRAGIERRPSFICLAVYPDQHDAALRAGAARFLRKDGSPRELVEAVRAAASPPPA
jgi:DNA-binding NarL/FixJ family response regulator